MLTRLVRSIRELVLRESERQGKPFLLAARVPVTVELCRRIGIDIAGWLNAELIDLLALSGGYVAFDQPVEELIELGHAHHVPVYPCLSQSGLMYRPPRGNGEPQPPAAWNGAALRFWEANADGIYTFNLFPGPGTVEQREHALTVLRAIGSRETLLAAERCFATCDGGNYMDAHFWAKDAEEFSAALPKKLGSQSATTIPLVVAGPPTLARAGAETELRLDVQGLAESEQPIVSFNSHPLGDAARADRTADVRRFRYTLPVDAAKTGRNEIRVEVTSAAAQLVGAELWIR